MTSLDIFQYQDQPVRTLTIDSQPAFVANDLCAVLDLANPRTTLGLLDDDEKGVHSMDTLGGQQQMAYVTEAGMYSLVLRSRKPEAKAFKRWITHEVLPQIRKTGSYGMAAPKELSRLELIDMARESELGRMQELEARRAAESKVLELEGPATAWDRLASAKGDLDVRDAAQVLCRDHDIQIGRNRLFRWLRAHRWVDANNRPYQNRVDQGLLTEKMGTFMIQRSAGEMLAPPQVRVTAKGLQRLQMELGAQDVAS